ncbi:SurA N-terminal domain-containing protein [Candidatus Woesearchaeota archaeon]|nr:SurA N-terminal domain-containing protein [Candidatus Woesearchaeota archaeon]
MNENKLNDYEEMMKNGEDFEEEVYVEKESTPEEEKISEEINKMGSIKSGADIKEEEQDIQDSVEQSPEEEEEISQDNSIEDKYEEEEPEIEIRETEEELEIKPIIKEEKTEIKKEITEEKNKPVVKNERKPKIVAKKSVTKKKVTHKKKKAIKTTAKKVHKVRKNKTSFWPITFSIIGIILIVLAIIFVNRSFPITPKVTGTVTIVNGEEITASDLDKEYEFFFLIGGLPEEYKEQITKELFLNSTLIPEILILQEATKNNIEVTEEEVDSFVQSSIAQSGGTIEAFEATIAELGLTLDNIKEYFKKQLVSFKLLNMTILKDIKITDAEVEAAYNENKDLFEAQNQTLEDIKADLTQALLIQKQRTAAQLYMEQLRANADIQIVESETDLSLEPTTQIIEPSTTTEETTTTTTTTTTEEETTTELVDITTFNPTGDELCTENGKPIVQLFSTTTCPHCVWIKDTFDEVVAEYASAGKIAAYHWELDIGDNTLTTERESSVPNSQVQTFQKYNPQGYVPVFVIGCKYSRIGNGYESRGDLVAEEAEFRAVIEAVLG